jgi:hypothetical protein
MKLSKVENNDNCQIELEIIFPCSTITSSVDNRDDRECKLEVVLPPLSPPSNKK